MAGSILKDVMVKFLVLNRSGKEVILDLKIGFIHAYPNGDMKFKKTVEDLDRNSNRNVARKLKSKAKMFENDLQEIGKAMSSISSTCFRSTINPNTLRTNSQTRESSKLSQIRSKHKSSNSTAKDWFKKSNGPLS